MSKLHSNNESSSDDPSFISLSQFDTELQQQAQLAMQQEIDAWKEFENYLPQLAYQNSFNQRSKEQSIQRRPLANNPPFIDLAANHLQLDNLLTSQDDSNNMKIYSRQNNVNWSPTLELGTTNNLNNIPFVSPNSDPAISPFSSPSSILEQIQSPCQHESPNKPSSTATTVNTTADNTPNQSPKSNLFSFDFPFISEQESNNNQDKTLHSNDTKSSPVIPPQKKRAHNVIERRYRNNINERITELKNAVPALLHAKVKDTKTGTKRGRKNGQVDDEDEDEEEDSEEYLDGITIATKLNKATILRKSTEYILHLRRRDAALRQENDILQQLVGQLPGGQDVLSRYLIQKAQREQKLHQQYLFERDMQKKIQQQRKNMPGRKKTRLSKGRPLKTEPIPLVPAAPSVTNRVFMAAFMAISFFSSSPLFTGPTTQEQFENHHHISRTADDVYLNNSSSGQSFVSSIFPTHDSWSTLRTTFFVICLFQLIFPLLKSKVLGGIKVKNVKRSRSKSSLSGNLGAHVTSLTPGDQKCMQIYSILSKSLESDSNNKIPYQKTSGTLSFYLALSKEFARFTFRHWLGYEILYEEQNPQEQWVQTCKWIKLNEVECLGGNPDVTRSSMLFSCLRVVNMIEAMEDDENEYVEQSRSRVFATAALQMSLIVPHHGIAETLARYFWRLAMYESGLEDDPLMSALTFDCHEDDGEDRMEVMIRSRAWFETLEVMNHQIQHADEVPGLSLSMSAPVLVPVGILSTLHLLDNLQTQFGRLIISVTDEPLAGLPEDENSDFSETVFAQILDITTPQEGYERVNEYHSLAHWLSAVGAIVEALWKSDVKTVDALIHSVLKKIPLSLVSREMIDEDTTTVEHKERLHQIDELTKKVIVHTLIGAALLKKGNVKDLKQGVDELCHAERLKTHVRNLSSHIDEYKSARCYEDVDLESSVLSLAEFVTAVTGLEAWIIAWRLVPSVVEDTESWEERLTKQVRNSCLQLRRMIGRHSFDGLRTNDAIVERLTRLGAYTSKQREDADSTYECSSDDDESVDFGKTTLRMRRSDKALDILRGLA
ncbi:hypothetical protein CU098_005372 [Rhizopus stolonifer]|uniref:BHLH domain-containing protein n=1 Tax=Rhizopus stolonifer TaxID=4846 RepID=A0A367KP43_RHIST|nr:hypothetical protein CU098_005372 [Rhizopus stolonifer]